MPGYTQAKYFIIPCRNHYKCHVLRLPIVRYCTVMTQPSVDECSWHYQTREQIRREKTRTHASGQVRVHANIRSLCALESVKHTHIVCSAFMQGMGCWGEVSSATAATALVPLAGHPRHRVQAPMVSQNRTPNTATLPHAQLR